MSTKMKKNQRKKGKKILLLGTDFYFKLSESIDEFLKIAYN